MATYRSGPTLPADIITYRLGSRLVYVKPADDYEQALDFAQKEFPELSHISRDHIEFTILASMGGERRMVRISESAWPAAVARLLRAEIIDINVRQDDSKEPPPLYLAVPQLTEGVHRKSLSAPSSPRSHSRSSSPSGRSEKGSSRHWFSKS